MFLAAVAAGCGSVTAADPTPVEPTPTAPTPVEPTPAGPAPVEPAPVGPTPADPAPVEPTPVEPAGPAPRGTLAWGDPRAVVDAGDGWMLSACEGGAPLVCVRRDGVEVGTVEALRFPVVSFHLGGGGQLDLDALAVDFVEGFVADRAAGCGDGYRVEALGAGPATVAGSVGLRFGFVGTTAAGESSELHLHHAVVDGDDVVIFAAGAYDEGGCPGRDELSGFDSASLRAAQPYLEAAISRFPLPPIV